MTEKNRKDKNFETEQATNNSPERYEPTTWETESGTKRWIPKCLGPDDQCFQYGRTVHIRLGKFGPFVCSLEANGSFTTRTASLRRARICPSQITLELAIRLLDKIDAYRLRKITRNSCRRSDGPGIGKPITDQRSNSRALYFISICIASE